MKVTQLLGRAVQTRASDLAVIDGALSRTWAELGDRVPRAAGALIRLGVDLGLRVAVLALNSHRYFELLFAVPWAGAVVVPLNTRWALPEVAQALDDADVSLLVFDDAFRTIGVQLMAQGKGVRGLYIGNAPCPAGVPNYESMLGEQPPAPDRSGQGDDLWGIFYTGGTTGHPKGVMLSHANVFLGALTWVPTMHFGPTTRYLNVAGFFHIAGTQPAMALAMAGAVLVLLPKFDPALALQAIERHRVNYCFFIPTMLNMLLHHPDLAHTDLSSVEYCQYAGAPTSEGLLKLALEKLPTWKLIQGYGQTEAGGMATSLQWEDHFGEGPRNKRSATGRSAYGIELKIADGNGHELPRGTVGEIVQRSATVMLGYWRNEAATAAAVRDGWLYTGDMAWMDDDGVITIVDRLKDMIVTGGENVFSKEVENALSRHEAVRDCAVIGIPHADWGEAVHAVVVLKEGASVSAEGLTTHCRQLIAAYKCPRSIEFRDALPLSAAGKIMKGPLREAHWAGRDRSLV